MVARELIGATLVRRLGNIKLRARIVETEAYLGPADLASHSSRGRTPRTDVMFGRAGYAYVYFIYGMHHMLNIVTGTTGEAHAVLLRAAEPLDGWEADLSGPGRLARCFEIGRSDNRADLTHGDIWVADSGGPAPRIAASERVGIEYAGEWKNALLRFYDADSRAVSRPPRRGRFTES